jgi:hypothetical protein
MNTEKILNKCDQSDIELLSDLADASRESFKEAFRAAVFALLVDKAKIMRSKGEKCTCCKDAHIIGLEDIIGGAPKLNNQHIPLEGMVWLSLTMPSDQLTPHDLEDILGIEDNMMLGGE